MLGLRHFAKLTLALAIALLDLGALSVGDLAAAEQPWTVTVVSGQANLVNPATGTNPVAQGDRVLAGHQIETGLNGRVVMARGDSTVTISPNSRTELPADAQGGRTTLFQALGAILLKIEKRAEQHFEVQTPYLAAVVKGTTFTVTAGAAQSAVHVVEGAVEVGSFATGDVALVRPGQTATVGAGSNAGVSLLGTPRNAPGQSSEGSSGDGEQREDRQAQGAGEGWEPSDGGAAATPETAVTATVSPPPQPIPQAAQAKAGFAKGVGLSGSGRPVVLDRAVGITSLDFSQLTGGLVRGPKPRSQRANLEPGSAGKAVAKGKAKGQSKGGSTLFKAKAGQPGVAANGAGRDGIANPGQAIANLVRAAGDPGTPSQSNGRALGRNQSASPSVSQGNGNAFGQSKDGGSPAKSVVANNGNNGNGNNGNGNNGNGNNGNGNNGNGNNGNGNNGNGNSGNGNSGNGNSGNNGNGNSGNGNSGNNGNGNSGNNGNGNGNNGNGNGNNGNGNGNNGNGNGNNGNGNGNGGNGNNGNGNGNNK